MNNSSFQVVALARKNFASLFQMTDADLAAQGMRRVIADKKPYYPCRISLVDAEIGEPVIFLSYEHLPVSSPQQSRGPIFVREQAVDVVLAPRELPEMLRHRLMAVRAFDAEHHMLGAEAIEGAQTASLIEQAFADPRVDYLHLHNAKVGCFFCRVNRV